MRFFNIFNSGREKPPESNVSKNGSDRLKRTVARAGHHKDTVEVPDHLNLKTEELREIAGTDALTGIPNRRKLEQALTTWVEAMSPNGEYRSGVVVEKIALAILDVDNFKIFNDTYGHDAGDKVLQQVAKRLREILESEFRSGDSVGRWGGEEFACVFPGMDPKTALRKLQKNLSSGIPVSFQSNNGETVEKVITLSGGISALPKPSEEEREAMKQGPSGRHATAQKVIVRATKEADTLLYKAKAIPGKGTILAVE